MRRGADKGRRGRRVASVIRQIVSEVLVSRLSDPRLAFVTVTGVDVSPDMRTADVRVSVLGEPKEQEECLSGIRHAHGRLQEKVAGALGMKFCPILRFHLDQSIKRSISLSVLIAKARAEDEAARADRIRRGVEDPEPLPPIEESEPQVDVGPEDEEPDEGPSGEDALEDEAGDVPQDPP